MPPIANPPIVSVPSVSTNLPVNNEHAEAMEEDSRPLDFNTFVPTHDPSLDAAAELLGRSTVQMPLVGQDEAFRKALDAMYWAGYWTAVYQCHRQQDIRDNENDGDDEVGLENNRQAPT